MLMSTDECFKRWRPSINLDLGDRALKAITIMREIIEGYRELEALGEIKDFQPLISTCNSTASIAAGTYNMECRFHPVIDGRPRDREEHIHQIL